MRVQTFSPTSRRPTRTRCARGRRPSICETATAAQKTWALCHDLTLRRGRLLWNVVGSVSITPAALPTKSTADSSAQ